MVEAPNTESIVQQIKAETQTETKKVVFALNVPVGCGAEPLKKELEKFGRVADVLVLELKRQAFVEFETAREAALCVEKYAGPLKLQLSHKSQISHKDEHEANKVLFITFANVKYPMTADLIYTTFLPCGLTSKVLLYTCQNSHYGLVEMDSLDSASKVKEAWNGHDLFSGANTMSIQYSRMKSIEIKIPTDRCKDYTALSEEAKVSASPVQSRPAAVAAASMSDLVAEFRREIESIGQPSVPATMTMTTPGAVLTIPLVPPAPPQVPESLLGLLQQKRPMEADKDQDDSPVLMVHNVADGVDPDKLFTLFACFGNVAAIRLVETQKGSALVQMQTKPEADLAKLYLNGCPLYGKEIVVNAARIKQVYMTKGTYEYTKSRFNRYYKPGSKNFSNLAVTIPARSRSHRPCLGHFTYRTCRKARPRRRSRRSCRLWPQSNCSASARARPPCVWPSSPLRTTPFVFSSNVTTAP